MEGIFTKEQEAKLAQLLDDAVKLKGVLELADGYVFKGIITFVDDNYVDKLGQELKDALNLLAEAVLNEDVEAAKVIAAGIINDMIDIPVLTEDAEGMLFKGALDLIVGAVMKWIESKEEVDG